MRIAHVCFRDLRPDEIVSMMSQGDLWCCETTQNMLAYEQAKTIILLNDLPGGFSSFPEDDVVDAVLEEVTLHYSPYGPIQPYCGPIDRLSIHGCDIDIIKRVFSEWSDDYKVSIKVNGKEIGVDIGYILR